MDNFCSSSFCTQDPLCRSWSMMERPPSPTSLHRLLYTAETFMQDPSTSVWSFPTYRHAIQRPSTPCNPSQSAILTPDSTRDTLRLNFFGQADAFAWSPMPIVNDDMAEFVAQRMLELSGAQSEVKTCQDPQDDTCDEMVKSNTKAPGEVINEQDAPRPPPPVADQHTPLDDTNTKITQAEHLPENVKEISDYCKSIETEVKEDVRRTWHYMERTTMAKKESDFQAETDEFIRGLKSMMEISTLELKHLTEDNVSKRVQKIDLKGCETDVMFTVGMLAVLLSLYFIVKE